MEEYSKRYHQWLEDPYFDEETKAELRALEGNENEIKERFYMDLEFGTAGLRGIIGAGTNRMNIYVVRKATQGLANYILKAGGKEKGVVIAHDSRRMYQEFTDCAALTLAANGIKAYVFDALRPTPELSYAVRHLGCIAGINITASPNPPAYNGYKVYWEDGAQITPPHDTGIMDEVKAITDYASCKTMEKSEAVAKGLYIEVGDKEVDTDYIEELKKNVLHPEAIRAEAKNLKIVYTPLHGTGLVPAKRVLKELGFENVLVVPEQEKPDGEFPTVSYPNPEADEAFTLGLKLAQETGADLVLATDPDADRLGVRVRDKDGVYHTLTGNMSGSLLADYEIGQRKALKGLPEDGLLIKTIVTTNLADAICKYYGVAEYECLTGFKWIGRQILKMENEGKGTYLFGFEESYGCLIGTHARDKDAIVAVMMQTVTSGWPATLIFSRLNFSNGVPAATSSPCFTRYSKPSPCISTVSMPTWSNTSTPLDRVSPTAWRESSISTVTLADTGATKSSLAGRMASPSHTMPAENTPSLTSGREMTSPSRKALNSCSLSLAAG